MPFEGLLCADAERVDRLAVIYLVDANVLSEPTRPKPDLDVIEWLRRSETNLVVNPIILGEIRFGIGLLPTGDRRRLLERWFDEGVRHIQCLSMQQETGLRWGNLIARLRAAGKSMPVKDSLIAATALEHDLIVATRNERDFGVAGVRTVNPFRA